MINWSEKKSYDCRDLAEIVRILRHPGGCPWDQEQTHASIRRNLLEEAYEAAEAIDRDDLAGLREELGDVLLQVYFHASIEEDAGRFTLDDVADGVCKKLIYRHPHVFGEVNVRSTQEVLSNWEELKKKEKHQTTRADELDAVARTLPALWRAEKVQKKAVRAGAPWGGWDAAMDKLAEELGEVKAAAAGEGDLSEELGDLLFVTVCACAAAGVDPEQALHANIDKDIARFRRVEELAAGQGKTTDKLSREEFMDLWTQAKAQLKQSH